MTDQPRWPSAHRAPTGREPLSSHTVSVVPTEDRAHPSASVVPPPPAQRTRDERYDALVTTIRAAKQARRDSWREMAHSLRRIKEERLWEGRGYDTFDRWAWGTLRFNRTTVSSLLGAATDPIGGTGRRPGPKPGSPRAPGRARGQVGEVEGIRETAIPSTSVSPQRVATARDFVAWAARQLDQLQRHDAPGRVAGLTAAERVWAGRVFDGMIECFVAYKQALAGEEDATDA